MGKYLVTGAAGFIGSALAARLVENGHDVVTIDNLTTGYKENIPHGCHFIEGDVHDSRIVDRAYKNNRFDAIYHVAGQSSGEISFENPIYDLEANTASALLLLNRAKDTGCKKFIYASTMSVYGDENECPVTETSEVKPKSFYAVGKLASEHYMRIYTQFGIKSTALRINNVYGPGQNLNNLQQGMASIFVAQAIRTGEIHVMGAKERFRDFVYIEDVVDAFTAAEAGSEKNLYNVYNIATNVKTTVEELVSEIVKNIPSNVTVKYEGSTPGDQFGIYCSYGLIENSLGWMPKVQLCEGIKVMVEWALKKNTI